MTGDPARAAKAMRMDSCSSAGRSKVASVRWVQARTDASAGHSSPAPANPGHSQAGNAAFRSWCGSKRGSRASTFVCGHFAGPFGSTS